ncbi:MAG: alpha-L-fucosidase [Victivallaceae bacterium]|nr:alpha-L-fucosidase [Victivallaceae bacterium]
MSQQESSNEVAEQHDMIGNSSVDSEKHDYKRTTHLDAQWFQNAGLGLFIHWGISSVRGDGDLSWSMISKPHYSRMQGFEDYGMEAVGNVTLSPAKYWDQAKYFNPDNYNPDKWLSVAREAGVKYAVLTTKHHDGFALWPSEYGDFNTKNYSNGQDLVAEYVEACRKNDIKVGLYYSPPDWYWNQKRMSFNYDDTHPLGLHHESITLPTFSEKEQKTLDAEYNKYIRNQVIELLTGYGKIDIIWFDGKLPQKEHTISMDEIHELQPGILVNPRGHGYGDYTTPECAFPKTRPEGWWEFCNTFNSGGWGYRTHELYKPAGYFLKNLAETRAWGGNFLFSVAPDSHGELPEVYYKRMVEITNWMKENREVMFDSEPGEWPEKSNVPALCKGNTIYALLDALSDGGVEMQTETKPKSVKLRRNGQDIPYTYDNGKLLFKLKDDLQTQLMDIIEIEL